MTLALGFGGLSALAGEIDLSDYEAEPWQADLGPWNFKLAGMARGAVYQADQPDFAGLHTPNVTGYAELRPSLTRVYDTGMTLSFNARLNIWHDRLSGDDYENDFFEDAYAALQTGLGRVEVGMTKGPAYAMAISGPYVAPETSINGYNTTFFLDPSGGQFPDIFAMQSAVSSTQNYTKLVYYTPAILGWKVGVAFTPSTAKDVIPFVFAAQKIPDRQEDFWELAVNYGHEWDSWTLSSYASFVFAHNAQKTRGGAGLTDWGFGAQLDYALDEDTKLSFGGGFRETNAYALDTFFVGAQGVTQSLRMAAGITQGPWSLVAEYGHGHADRPREDTIGIEGQGVSLGYQVNENLQLAAGWQSLRYNTDSIFYDGSQHIRMDAFYLHALFDVGGGD